MNVADSSALISFFLREPGWKRVREHLDFVVTIELSKKEIYNAIWKAHKLRNRLTREQVREALGLVKEHSDCCVVLEDQDHLLDEALELALTHGLTVYDSLFVALSVIKGLSLVSLDEKQRRVARALGVEVLP